MSQTIRVTGFPAHAKLRISGILLVLLFFSLSGCSQIKSNGLREWVSPTAATGAWETGKTSELEQLFSDDPKSFEMLSEESAVALQQSQNSQTSAVDVNQARKPAADPVADLRIRADQNPTPLRAVASQGQEESCDHPSCNHPCCNPKQAVPKLAHVEPIILPATTDAQTMAANSDRIRQRSIESPAFSGQPLMPLLFNGASRSVQGKTPADQSGRWHAENAAELNSKSTAGNSSTEIAATQPIPIRLSNPATLSISATESLRRDDRKKIVAPLVQQNLATEIKIPSVETAPKSKQAATAPVKVQTTGIKVDEKEFELRKSIPVAVDPTPKPPTVATKTASIANATVPTPVPMAANNDFQPAGNVKVVDYQTPSSDVAASKTEQTSGPGIISKWLTTMPLAGTKEKQVTAAPDVAVPAVAKSEPKLAMSNVQFCTEIKGFGQVVPFGSNKFQSNQQTLVYCEVENYRSIQRSTPAGIEFVTRLGGRYTITDASDRMVEAGTFPDVEDVTNRQRRDFYLYFPIGWKDLPSGKYRLQLEIQDLSSGSSTKNAPTIEFSVK